MIMKRLMITLVAMMAIAVSAHAMSFSKARSHALYLTDKMGYELDLTDDQYNAVYEINLDYMISLNFESDLYGFYWTRRNNELKFVLSTYQYQRFLVTEYFYRPIGWQSKSFTFVIYRHYPKNRFYRNAPRVYDTYKGGNRQYHYSPYQGRTYSNDPNRNARQLPQAGSRWPQPDKKKSQAIRGARQQTISVPNQPQGTSRKAGDAHRGGRR